MTDQDNKIVPVILSGGAGTRLWPLSREAYPKQFLPLTGERSLFQETALRVRGIPATAPPILVCNEEHRFMAAEQLRVLDNPAQAILLEPSGRNTAPAVAVAALAALAGGADPILLVLPADHVIVDVAGFRQAVSQAVPQARADHLITFGIMPDAPETGYGYIKAGAPVDEGVYRVERFVEKPDRVTAQGYLDAGGYYWNSGMFLFRAARYLDELERLAPAMAAACREAHTKSKRDHDFTRLDSQAFAASPSDSIDYAVMEKTTAALVLPIAVGWSDVGSWSALWQVGERDQHGNVTRGDVLAVDSHRSFIHAQSRLVATVGVDDLVVVETPDAVLVARKDSVQHVKAVVESLKRENRPERKAHRKVYRPWGAYDSIDHAERFQVKRITVNPGASLSLQMHHHRAEHWVVVRGTARVTRGEEVVLLGENQSTYIPLGCRHRLENPGKIPLEIIEVQSGPYLGEDDIVRLDDHYGRTNSG
ncbi:MAG: mannose-1-phosphate guanylyltransferase/mannose-6-phosphate isomerase [Gammaproteobacteria bacterium]